MVLDTLRSAWWAMWAPRVLLPSAVATIGFAVAFQALGLPGLAVFSLSSPALSALVMLVIARSWFGLTMAATALSVLRGDKAAPLVVGVPVLTAGAVALVTMLALVVLVLGGLLLVPGVPLLSIIGSALFVPGLWLAIMWSQAGMLLIDGRADLLEAPEASSFLTRGYRPQIAAVWILAAIVVAAASGLDDLVRDRAAAPVALVAHLALRVFGDVFGTCCIAAVYYELDRSLVRE